MAKLKIEDIRNDFVEEGWELLSEKYVNLNGELEAKCPLGHLNYVSYGKWRKNKGCAICAEHNIVHVPEADVPVREKGVVRVLALDAATKDTGWSVFDDGILVSYGVFRVSGDDSVKRMATLRQWLSGALDAWKPDKVAIEDIQLQTYYNAASRKTEYNVTLFKTLAQLQGALLVSLYEKKVEYCTIYVATWRNYCGISARYRDDQKKAAQRKVNEWYGISVNNDVAEAICLGKYTAEKYMKNNTMVRWGE